MRFRFLLLILFCIGGSVLAQDEQAVIFEMRDLVPLPDGAFLLVMVDHPDYPNNLRLQLYDADQQLKAEETIDIYRRGVAAQYESAFVWQGELVLLTSLYYPGPKRNHLIMRRFTLPELDNIFSGIMAEAYTPSLYRIPFGFDISPDSTHMLLYSWTYTLPEDAAKLDIQVLDQSYQMVWERRYILPYKNATLYVYGSALTNDLRTYLFCENYEGNPGNIPDPKKVDYFLLAMNPDSEEIQHYELRRDDRFLTGLSVRPLKDNRVIGAGFYQEKRNGGSDGIFTFEVNPDGSDLDLRYIPVSKDQYDAAYLYAEKESGFSSNKRKFGNYYIDEIILQASGDWRLVGEQQMDRPGTPQIEFNDILVADIPAKQSRLKTFMRVPKRQLGFYNQEDLFSYTSFKRNDGLFLLFNDSPSNHDDPEKLPRSMDLYTGDSRTAIAMFHIDEDGSWMRYNLAGALQAKGVQQLIPGRCRRLSNDKGLIYGEKRTGPLTERGMIISFELEPFDQGSESN